MQHGNLGVDWRDGWHNVRDDRLGVEYRGLAQGRPYLDIYETTLVSDRTVLPVEPTKVEGDSTGYRLRLIYQPTTRPDAPLPHALATCYPSAKRIDIPLPPPGMADAELPSVRADWLTRELALPTADDDNAFDVRIASGRQEGDLGDLPPIPHDVPDDGPNWPGQVGQVHFRGVTAQDPNLHGVEVKAFLRQLLLDAAAPPVTLDGIAPRWKIDGAIPICQGGQHTLLLPVLDSCGWSGNAATGHPGTHAYAYWEDEDEAQRLGLTLEASDAPPDDDAQHIDKPWRLDCAPDGLAGNNTLVIESIYDAPPFPLTCVTGPFKILIAEQEGPSYWPCVALEESAQARVQILNAVSGLPAQDVPVQWSVAGKVEATTPTDSEGWAQFEYTPKADTTFDVLVDAPYNTAPSTASIDIPTIAAAHWDMFDLTLDGRTIHPVHGRLLIESSAAAPQQLKLTPRANNPSIGRMASLRCALPDSASDTPVLEIDPAPEVERVMPAQGLTWTIRALTQPDAPAFEIHFDCAPWKTAATSGGTVVPEIFDIVALPTQLTCMDGEVFVFGGAYTPDSSGDRGIVLEARTRNGQRPLPGIPCTIAAFTPSDGLASLNMTPAVGEVQVTDAQGQAFFRTNWVFGDRSTYDDAQFIVTGGDAAPSYPVRFRLTPSVPDVTGFAHIYPAMPEHGAAYAKPHLRVYLQAREYLAEGGTLPPHINVILELLDGSTLGPYANEVWQSRSIEGTTLGMLLDMPLETTTSPVKRVRAYAGGEFGEKWHFVADLDARASSGYKAGTKPAHEPYAYAAVTKARRTTPMLIQFPTFLDEPGMGVSYEISPQMDGVTSELLPFEFGETATAVIRSGTGRLTVRIMRRVGTEARIWGLVELEWTPT
ncbi:hypothetical protein [Pandoraea sputorum]|uniref:hypothetical protein n=1 Tax=Pandoraea sputorum TaxID=93222 RepID=UPI00123F6935|nr:hypothetical protein [Pandoraea sputorum]